jgi:gamma-glutamylputrescine synthase
MSTILAGILHGLDNDLPLQEEVEGNGLEQEGLPFLSARAMRCGSLCKTTVCVNYWVSVLATCITPVKTMN